MSSVTREEFEAIIGNLHKDIDRVQSDSQNMIHDVQVKTQERIDAMREWMDNNTNFNKKMIVGFGSFGTAVGSIALERLFTHTSIAAQNGVRLEHIERILCAMGSVAC